MPSYVSPGVYVIEKDWSDYTPSLNSTTVGVMGFASQGPVGKATLCTTQEQLINTFGRPDDAEGGLGLVGGYQILERTNALYYTRAATVSANVADAPNLVGNCPHVNVNEMDADAYYFFMVSVSDSGGVTQTPDPLLFNCSPASATSATTPGAAAKVQEVVNQSTTPESPVSFVVASDSAGNFVGSYAGKDAMLHVTMWSSTDSFGIIPAGTDLDTITSYSGQNAAFSSNVGNTIAMSCGFGLDSYTVLNSSNCMASALTLSADAPDGGCYHVRTLYPGAGYNYSSTFATYGPKVTGLQTVTTARQGADSVWNLLKAGGSEESVVVNLTDNTSGTSLNPEDEINNTSDESNKTSEYIIGEFAVDNSTLDSVLWTLPTAWGDTMTGNGATSGTWIGNDGTASALAFADVPYAKLVNNIVNFTNGVNGDLGDGSKSWSDAEVKAAVIGNGVAMNGIYSYLAEDVDISMLAIPGCTEQNIVNGAVTLAETSQEFLYVTNPPLGISSPQNAIAWSNGTAEGRTAALNSSYACVYWPWVKLFNTFTQVDEYMSPDIFAIRQMCFTDATFDAWVAPAGLTRGRLTKPVDVEMVLTQGDRDALYGAGNCINPIQKFLTDGIVIWGQRTTQRTPTSLDRINVRRLMIIIRKMLLASTRQFVFEPNDAATWKRITNAVEPMMADIKSRRGVTDFKVICDSTTNTPIRIDRSELWCKVILQPVKAAEVIVFELNLTSATLGLNLPTA